MTLPFHSIWTLHGKYQSGTSVKFLHVSPKFRNIRLFFFLDIHTPETNCWNSLVVHAISPQIQNVNKLPTVYWEWHVPVILENWDPIQSKSTTILPNFCVWDFGYATVWSQIQLASAIMEETGSPASGSWEKYYLAGELMNEHHNLFR
jgi:hypothetical protein